ncbi:hypothetical protein GUJ93_ZPchr0009g484 [Zizania palustris]|uniref:Uncharacterized protein n=1 Tax=Zizania palustris TaxID=103762 RepID=A0A8J5RPB9_ZIZPA|nr:hypothetical protein GUJ93_ZPchr0009g484 [Zizania palustris]
MSEREAQHRQHVVDLPEAGIESFSQLPFVRPRPAAAGGSSPSSIRLFGFELPPDGATSSGANSDATAASSTTAAPGQAAALLGALGGHQNAHKRERQHAKRAQFQSTMPMHTHYPAHAYQAFASYHISHRFGPAPPHIGRYDPPPPPSYPSWSNHHLATALAPTVAARYYGAAGSVAQPINGNPVPAAALLRVPAIAVAAPLARPERPARLSLAGRGFDRHVGLRRHITRHISLLTQLQSTRQAWFPRLLVADDLLLREQGDVVDFLERSEPRATLLHLLPLTLRHAALCLAHRRFEERDVVG